MIRNQTPESDFFIPDCEATSSEYSAFNTHDFQRMQRPFDKYGYAVKKIMERIRDLAIMHSVISSEEGRLKTQKRYESLLDLEFRNRLLRLVERYKRTHDAEKKFAMKQKIGELYRRILDGKRIWERYAPRDT